MLDDKVSLDMYYNFKTACEKKYSKKEEVIKLQTFVWELASIKQFNTFEEQFTEFKNVVENNYYKVS